MTPDQRFSRWVRIALAAFAVLFVYFLVADSFMPMTPEARVMRPVTQIAPELGAPVQAVLVNDHQRVAAGEVLFRLEPAPFELARQQALLNREQAEQENARLRAELAAAGHRWCLHRQPWRSAAVSVAAPRRCWGGRASPASSTTSRWPPNIPPRRP